VRCVLLVVSFATLVATAAHAQQPTCILQAIEKKLAGPARSDFMNKCAADVQTTCDRLADQRKLEGVERTIFVNNCVTLYVGPR
jgi:hypothetical protein